MYYVRITDHIFRAGMYIGAINLQKKTMKHYSVVVTYLLLALCMAGQYAYRLYSFYEN